MTKKLLILGCLTLASCGVGGNGVLETACRDAGRPNASAALCSCVQGVADQTLSGPDQRRAATFFANPDLAQQTRQADGRATEAFWDRYRAFADAARQSCG